LPLRLLVNAVALSMVPALAAGQVGVGPEFHVNTYTTGLQANPSVAAEATGAFVIAWTSAGPDGAGEGIFGQRYDASGTPVGSEFQINSYTTGEQYGPRVASDPDGNFVVVWVSAGQDGSHSGIYARRYDTTSGPGPEFRVNTHTPNRQGDPAVAMDPSGAFVATWHSLRQEGDDGVYAQRYDASGNAQAGEFRVNAYTTVLHGNPDVAMDPSGTFVVAWQGNDLVDGIQTRARRFDATGTPAGPEFLVVTTGTIGAENAYPSVATDADGRFVIVWTTHYGGGPTPFNVRAQRYDADGTPQGASFQVNSYTTGYQARPVVASDAAGNFVVTWHSYNGQYGGIAGIFGRRFDRLNNAVGGDFQVNTYTTGRQEFASLSMDAAGNFVTAWMSDVQEGPGNPGIYAQRFLADLIFRDGFEAVTPSP
jgi:hypothetical protein